MSPESPPVAKQWIVRAGEPRANIDHLINKCKDPRVQEFSKTTGKESHSTAANCRLGLISKISSISTLLLWCPVPVGRLDELIPKALISINSLSYAIGILLQAKKRLCVPPAQRSRINIRRKNVRVYTR